MQQMRRGVIADAFLAVVGKPALGGFRLRLFLVLGEGGLETLHVDAKALLPEQFVGKLNRKTKGVVQTERDLAFKTLAPGLLKPFDLLLEHFGALRERLLKTVLFLPKFAQDRLATGFQLRVLPPILLDNDFG